jgi:flavin reductase (DIM6/NTAB) family NADH-FMN oxidoreductase RutF
VDYFGISTGKNTDKLADTNLSMEKSNVVNAPMIKEFPLNIECRLKDVVEIGLHTQFIGEIMDVKALESILGEKDVPDVALLDPVVFSPVVRKYHTLGKTVGNAFDLGKKFRKKNQSS